MQMPFTAAQFFGVFRAYNEWLWPGQLVLYSLAFIMVSFALGEPRRSRIVLVTLAAMWAWMAVGYHLAFFTSINPAARVFAGMFLLQAALMLWHAVHTGRLRISTELEPWRRRSGLLLVGYALVAYPIVGYLLGQRFPALPTFGLPCPTTIFTLAILLWCERPLPWTVFVVPALWSVIATSAAVSFGVGEDYALLPATVAVLAVVAWRSRQPRRLARRSSKPWATPRRT